MSQDKNKYKCFISLTWPRFFFFFSQKQKNKVESSTEKRRCPGPGMIEPFCLISQYFMVSWSWGEHFPSAGLKQQDGDLAQVEVDEMLGLVGHIAAKVPPNNAVPGRIVFLVKLLGGTETHDAVNESLPDTHFEWHAQ